MNFLFPYLVGGAVVYVLFVKKPKPCPPCAVIGDDAVDAAHEAEAPPVGDLCALVREAAKGVGKAEAELSQTTREAIIRLKALRDANAVTPAEVSACLPKSRIAG